MSGKFSNPSAVIAMALGAILIRADIAVTNFDDKATGELDAMLQEFAEVAREYYDKARATHINEL